MKDQPEVYPFERVVEPGVRNRRGIKKGLGEALKKKNLPGYLGQTRNLTGTLRGIATLENLLLGIVILLMSRAFVLGELLPFVFAGIAAFGYQNKGRSLLLMIFAAVGSLTVLSGAQFWTNILVIGFLAGVVNYLDIDEEKAWWRIPILVFSIVLVIKSLIAVLGEFSFYAEMVIVFEALIAGILTVVFVVADDTVRRKRELANFGFEDISAFLILGVGIILGLSGISIFGINISSTVCRFGILVSAYLWGSGGGCMVGVMCGVIPSISSSVFVPHLGMYALSGILAGLFKSFGKLGVIIGFMMGTLAFSMFIPENQSAVLGIWETGIASLGLCLLPKVIKDKIPVRSLGPITNQKENGMENIDAYVRETARDQIKQLGEVFEELSCTFTKEVKCGADDKGATYLNYLFTEISSNFCEGCSRNNLCWGRNFYETSQGLMQIFTLAEKGKRLTFDDAPIEFQRDCLFGKEVVKVVNYLYDNLRTNEFWLEKLIKSRNIVAQQLKGASTIMKDLADEIDIKAEVDYALKDKLARGTKRMGMDLKEIIPIRNNGGQLSIKVAGNSCRNKNKCELEIAPAISSLVGENLGVCEKNCPHSIGKGQCEFTLSKTFAYRVETGAAQVGKEDICGDSFTISTLKEGKELVALSDGMGVGEKAYAESQVAVRLLENLLNSGFKSEVALNTINSVLMLKSTVETFATVDMVMIDLYNAEVDFVKIASAPSYIKRGKKVGVITSNSLPIGILEEIEIPAEKRVLRGKDFLVLTSDGISDTTRYTDNKDWLPDFLGAISEDDPQVIAEMIINKALCLCDGKPKDDMTVICARIDYLGRGGIV